MKSNLPIRVLIAVLFGPPLLILSYLGKIYFLILILFLTLLALLELSHIFKIKAIELPRIPFLVFGLLIGAVSYSNAEGSLWLVIFSSLLFAAIFQIIKKGTQKAILNIGGFMFGLIYVPFLFSFLILIRELPKAMHIDYRVGGLWVIFILLCVWFSDTLAYFIGAPLGKHKLCPRISPGKSLEGFFAGVAGSALAAVFSHQIFLDFIAMTHLIILSLIVGLVGQVGDLVESSFKREADLKDSSHILPGHGGILDRFDSLLFAAPAVYFYLKFIIYR
jgi:phosphatidate cytidylyltransferase